MEICATSDEGRRMEREPAERHLARVRVRGHVAHVHLGYWREGVMWEKEESEEKGSARIGGDERRSSGRALRIAAQNSWAYKTRRGRSVPCGSCGVRNTVSIARRARQ
jgi:hypothetical protein